MAAREIITLGFGSFGNPSFITLFGFGGPIPMEEPVADTAAGSTKTDPRVLALTATRTGQQGVYTSRTSNTNLGGYHVTGAAFDEIRE